MDQKKCDYVSLLAEAEIVVVGSGSKKSENKTTTISDSSSSSNNNCNGNDESLTTRGCGGARLKCVMSAGKLLQRRCYDLLNYRFSLLVILLALACVVVGVFRFGEVWLAWSKEKYKVVFHSFNDNIMSISYQKQLCQHVPIDVVYTWVNGSDSQFEEALKGYAPIPNDNVKPSRFHDKDELKYSLRSLEKFAPWIRKVYIVTNGQIPSWLDMDNPRVTLVTHEDIFVNKSHLPTFSSPAIESHIHRIPELSNKFLYFNDDIILGSPIWPEDFLTWANGEKIYFSWWVPDCSDVCPWTWVKDGACDPSCNTTMCEFDGGDCDGSVVDLKEKSEEYVNIENDYSDEMEIPEFERMDSDEKLLRYKFEKQDHVIKERLKTAVLDERTKTSYMSKLNKLMFKSLKSHEKLREIMQLDRYKTRMEGSIDAYTPNTTQQKEAVKASKTNTQLSTTMVLNDNIINLVHHVKSLNANDSGKQNRTIQHRKKLRSLDAYAESLLYVNKIYNRAYGIERRKVPAHMPHLLDRTIIDEMQRKFAHEFDMTSSHRMRDPQDMQFAFSYYYFLISEKREVSVEEIFDAYDTDGSKTWSDREIRTLLTRMHPLPLDYTFVLEFESIIINCSRFFVTQEQAMEPPLGERYVDSALPLVTKELVCKCGAIIEKIRSKFGYAGKYPYKIVDATKDTYFEMLTSNISSTVRLLDEIRKEPRKFICLNDDLDPERRAENEVVRALLNDLYRSYFPNRSSFELPPQYRNRFTHRNDLREWRAHRTKARNIMLVITSILLFILFYQTFRHRVRRLLPVRVLTALAAIFTQPIAF